jgi:hypothetical protein
MAGGIPEPVRRLVADHVKSVEQLEVLLLLRREAGRDWDGPETSAALQTTPESAGRCLEHAAASGFATESGGRYRYAASGGVARTVDELADAYAKRRHAVIAMIFESPSDAVQSFADAFRLRGDR